MFGASLDAAEVARVRAEWEAGGWHRCGEPVNAITDDTCGRVPTELPYRKRKLTAVHRRVFARDGYACRYCGRQCVDPLSGEPRRPDVRTLDHVVPRSRGGRHIDDNCVVACSECNTRKGSASWVPRPAGGS